VYYYPGFNAVRDAPKLRAELTHNLTRETGTSRFPASARQVLFTL